MPRQPRIVSIIISASFLLLFQTDVVFTQQQGARLSADDLLRKAGISSSNPGGKAPDFRLSDLNGNTVTLSGYRGNLVFLNFWATWCAPCRQEMPSMERLYKEFGGQGLAMLAVNERESAAQVSNFMRSYGLSFPALLDGDGRASSSYRVWGLPTTFLIDSSSTIIGIRSGPKDWASREVMAAFRKLLGDTGNIAGVRGSLIIGPAEPLPGGLRVKTPGSSVHLQQDAQSELIAKLARGEDLILLGKASGAGEVWYMIKTKSGAVGWIKANDVEEATKSK
jgi:peroxiredoxin